MIIDYVVNFRQSVKRREKNDGARISLLPKINLDVCSVLTLACTFLKTSTSASSVKSSKKLSPYCNLWRDIKIALYKAKSFRVSHSGHHIKSFT